MSTVDTTWVEIDWFPRITDQPFDTGLGGAARGADRERDIIRGQAAAGATWWMEYVYPGIGGLEMMHECIRSGPVRAD